ncbi:MAG: hypothetical protein PHG95_04215 [Patescibacteria group bacterium]|nr:hypothetical protein [Patescibacteria group bacterium]
MFTDEHIFSEKGEVLVKNAQNTSEESNRVIPQTLKLKSIEMNSEEKNKILHRFEKAKKEKTKSRTRRPAYRQ